MFSSVTGIDFSAIALTVIFTESLTSGLALLMAYAHVSPTFTPKIVLLSLNFAIVSSATVHENDLSSASSGRTVTVRAVVYPLKIETSCSEHVTDPTEIPSFPEFFYPLYSRTILKLRLK